MKYPKEVKEYIEYLKLYKQNDALIKFNIIQLYSNELAFPNGFYDSRFFEMHCFNTKTMETRVIKRNDGLKFIDDVTIDIVRIFADGSTLIRFKEMVKMYKLYQQVYICKDV